MARSNRTLTPFNTVSNWLKRQQHVMEWDATVIPGSRYRTNRTDQMTSGQDVTR